MCFSDQTRAKRLSSTERVSHESAATRRLGQPFKQAIKTYFGMRKGTPSGNPKGFSLPRLHESPPHRLQLRPRRSLPCPVGHCCGRYWAFLAVAWR